MTLVRITRDRFTDDAVIRFRYDPDVVDLIKTLPSTARTWRPDVKEWRIFPPSYVGELTEALEAAGHRVISTFGRATPPPPRPRSAAPTWADSLLAAVGAERVEPVHRALSKILHPDTATGDPALMTALNVARDRLAVTR